VLETFSVALASKGNRRERSASHLDLIAVENSLLQATAETVHFSNFLRIFTVAADHRCPARQLDG